MSNQMMNYKEKILKEIGDLSKEKINEVINFIDYIKYRDNNYSDFAQTDVHGAGDNVLLSIVGIGESATPHDLAQNHDKYVYPLK